jgi:hypothetical protein
LAGKPDISWLRIIPAVYKQVDFDEFLDIR